MLNDLYGDTPHSVRSNISDNFELRSVRIESPGSIDIEMADSQFFDEFTPVMGKFGAPKCRCTPSLISLIAMMIGLVVMTIGLCLVLFFTQEALFLPPVRLLVYRIRR
uniref:Col_cuticle_N domain-containing protein n=1 Tax=Heterorhabditis bacteriophora TaxID=37862 RepID=A0A1I7XCE4_HETBA